MYQRNVVRFQKFNKKNELFQRLISMMKHHGDQSWVEWVVRVHDLALSHNKAI